MVPAGSPGQELDPSILGVEAAKTFYQQRDNFNHNSFECASGANCDDYTQMMWASSLFMGIGIVQNCNPGQFLCTAYVVMRFSPAGNVADEYPSNVLPGKARFEDLMSEDKVNCYERNEMLDPWDKPWSCENYQVINGYVQLN